MNLACYLVYYYIIGMEIVIMKLTYLIIIQVKLF